MEKCNKKASSRVQQIKKIKILDKEFSVETGELTPLLKVKRAVVAKMYANIIDEVYASDTTLAKL